MKQLLVVGAGQLGSRHLQGLLKMPGRNQIYIVDPLKQSLDAARESTKEIEHRHETFFLKTLSELPISFDLAIVATNSLVREKVTSQLLLDFRITFLILEKVLFPDLEAYKKIGEQLKNSQTICWVNHPRRMFQHYKEIKNKFVANEPSVFYGFGGNWGLGCNGLHLLDIFSYLDGSKLQSISIDFLDDEIHASKREGFIEFTGTLLGKFSSGNTFQITSLKGDFTPLTVAILQSTRRHIVQEGGTSQVIQLEEYSDFKVDCQTFVPKYQSTLTTDLAAQLFDYANCDLPRFEEARLVHENFLSALLKKYNQITFRENSICPIT